VLEPTALLAVIHRFELSLDVHRSRRQKRSFQVASRGVRNATEIRAQVLAALGNRLASEGSQRIDTQVPGTK
jgi:hypothetical protein